MKVHVTGGSGFLGGYVIHELLQHGHAVSALARSDEAAQRVAELGAAVIPGDLDDHVSTQAAFSHAEAESLVNLASLGFGHAPTIVRAAEEAGLNRAIFVSTTAIYTRLAAPSKDIRIASEGTIRSSKLAWTIVRPTMIYGGPGDRNIARLLRALECWPLLPIPRRGGGMQQPVHVADVAHAIVTALERPHSVGQEYELAGPDAIPLRQLVTEAGAAAGRCPQLVPVPLALAVGAVRAHELLSRRPRLKAEQVRRLAEDKAFNINQAAADLGYRPRSFTEGVREEARLVCR